MVESKGKMTFGITNAHAAGIDVGSRFHCVSVGEGKEDGQEFGVFTEDLHALCTWLKSKGVQSVAMESTGFYWKQLFLMIQSYGMEACLATGVQVQENVHQVNVKHLLDAEHFGGIRVMVNANYSMTKYRISLK